MINRKIKENYMEEEEGVNRGGRKEDQISLRDSIGKSSPT